MQFHQLLAVMQPLREKARLIMTETITTFKNRMEHFDGFIRTYAPRADGAEQMPKEAKHIVTTVGAKLLYSAKDITVAIDAVVSKEETNSSGNVKANLVVDEMDFGEFSGTSLLALEAHLKEIRLMYLAIPTLDPAHDFTADEQAGLGFYITDPKDVNRSIKVPTPVIVVPATDKHAAKGELVSLDTFVGVYSTTFKSGRMASGDKAILLGRIDLLITAVKKARAEANQADHKVIHIGERLFNFINADIVKN